MGDGARLGRAVPGAKVARRALRADGEADVGGVRARSAGATVADFAWGWGICGWRVECNQPPER